MPRNSLNYLLTVLGRRSMLHPSIHNKVAINVITMLISIFVWDAIRRNIALCLWDVDKWASRPISHTNCKIWRHFMDILTLWRLAMKNVYPFRSVSKLCRFIVKINIVQWVQEVRPPSEQSTYLYKYIY